jgi:hypothetical protein
MRYTPIINATLCVLWLLLALPGSAQTRQVAAERQVSSSIEKVAVFLSGAQITRVAKVDIPSGRSKLIFGNISPNIDAQSIQVMGEGAFTILSVNHQLNYLEEQARAEEIVALEGEKYRIAEEKNSLLAMLAVYMHEEEMLRNNQAIGGQQNGVITGELRQALDFQRARMTEVLMRQLEFNNSIAKIDSGLVKIDKQLIALKQKKNLATSDIVIQVSAPAPVSDAKFEISYLAKDAVWFINYDLRVKDIDSPIDLAFKAMVTQSSGEDWKDVKLTLSSGDPSTNLQARELSPWRLRFGRAQPIAMQTSPGSGGIALVSGVVKDKETGEPLIGASVMLKGSSLGTVTDMEGRYTLNIPPQPATLTISYAGYHSFEIPVHTPTNNISLTADGFLLEEVVVAGLSGRVAGLNQTRKSRADGTIPQQTTERYQPTVINFEIEAPYTILNDGKVYAADIKVETLPATYEYFAAPKRQEIAFLIASIVNWQAYNLLDGEINLFFEGAYLGKSLLDTGNSSDTLIISLGQDKNVTVKRTRSRELSSRQFIGANKTEQRGFEIFVKNNKAQTIDIVVRDQFPISTDKSIVVFGLQYEGAERDRETEIITWKTRLAPKEEKRLRMGYSVRYPKREILVLE